MRKLAFVLLAAIVLPLQSSPSAQQVRPDRLANEFCYPQMTDQGWMPICTVTILENGFEFSVAEGGSPTWSPDGTALAYSDGYSIYKHDRVTGITSAVAGDPLSSSFGPSWSPAASRIAFVRVPHDSTGAWAADLFVVNPDGSQMARLTAGVGFNGNYAWSPNGRSIAFGRNDSGQSELYVMNADGSNARRLTYQAGFRGGISWAPDGSRIAFDCGTTICAINADGANLAPLAGGPANAFSAVFSPADGRVAYLVGTPGWAGALHVMNSDGSILRAAPDMLVLSARWSPDGASLALGTMNGGGAGTCNADGSPCAPPDETYIVRADGSDLRFVGYGINPVWFIPQPGQPYATFSADCTGAACEFNAAGSFDPDGAIATYAWRFGDGSTASGASPSHAFSVGGTYYVSLTVIDADGGRDVRGYWVSANAAPVASFTVVCDGPTCTFDGSGSFDPDGTTLEYSWTFGDGNATGVYYGTPSAAVVTHTYATGTFTATLQVWDRTFASSEPQSRSVTVTNAVPVPSFTATCAGLLCQFDASSSSDPDGTIIRYSWKFDAGAASYGDGQTTSYRYTAGGSYTATLTVYDNASQSTSTSRQVTVVAPPPPPPGLMHVGDLNGSSGTQAKSWSVSVVIVIHTQEHGNVENATVTGTWHDGVSGSCTTTAALGTCEVLRSGLPRKGNNATFTVTGVTHPSMKLDAARNHDPDGNSNGTTIVVRR